MRDTFRYVIRTQGAIVREMQSIDVSIDEALRLVPVAPSRSMWYKADQGQQTLPKTVRGIAQTIVQVERTIHPTRPHREWREVLEKLFVPIEL